MDLKTIEDKRGQLETELIGCGARRYFDENKDNYVICADSDDTPYAGLAEWPEFNGFYFDTKEEADKAVEQIGWNLIFGVMYAQKKKDVPVKEALEKILQMYEVMEFACPQYDPSSDYLVINLMERICAMQSIDNPFLEGKELLEEKSMRFAKILEAVLKIYFKPRAWGNQFVSEEFIKGWEESCGKENRILILAKPFGQAMHLLVSVWKEGFSGIHEIGASLALLARSLGLSMQDVLDAFEKLGFAGATTTATVNKE